MNDDEMLNIVPCRTLKKFFILFFIKVFYGKK